MPIHCPNCRRDNVATTRFCTACGAVLVESLPGGGRRRVLRPWGLRNSAPLTESPAMPEIAAAYRTSANANATPGRRGDLMLAGGVALVAVAGLFAYPFAIADQVSSAAGGGPAGMRLAVVAVPTASATSELSFGAPPLVEPQPIPLAPTPHAARVTTSAENGPRANSRQMPPLTVPVTFSMPARDAVVVGDGESVQIPSLPEAPPAPVDSWQVLRDALGACSRSTGVWVRATCEQRARLAHCDGHWGNVALCPNGRTESSR